MDDARKETAEAFARLYDIMRTLRGPDGCPWDKDQTSVGLRYSLMEESFEAIDAITGGDPAHICEELGDVFFNVIFQAYLYEETGDFTVAQSLNSICDKLIRRHPHVFAGKEEKSGESTSPQTMKDLLGQWENIKENLEGRKGDSILDTVPQGFPPLLRAWKMLKKASRKEGSRQTTAEAFQDLTEKIQALPAREEAVEKEKSSPDSEAFTMSGGNEAVNKAQLELEADIGQALFALVNYSRLAGVNPALALDRANRAFYHRFTAWEKEKK